MIQNENIPMESTTTENNKSVPENYLRQISEANRDIIGELNLATGQINWHSNFVNNFLQFPKGASFECLDDFIRHLSPESLPRFKKLWKNFLKISVFDTMLSFLTTDGIQVWCRAFVLKPQDSDSNIDWILVIRPRNDAMIDFVNKNQQSVKTLAAGLAHEFNNGLTPIRGFIELAIDQLDKDLEITQDLMMALDRVEYLAQLVEQIQQYGQQSLIHTQEVDISKTLPSIVNVSHKMLGLPNNFIKLEMTVPDNLPALMLDSEAFRRVVDEVIKNASKAMPKGGILTVEAFTHQVGEFEEFIVVNVKDTGVGISTENLTDIYDPFFTTHGRANSKGMGLSMVKGIVEQHGGWIQVSSIEGVGTEVRLNFPVLDIINPEARVGEESGGDEEELNVIPAADVGRMLIADDEEYIRQLINKVFKPEGWVVDEAVDYLEVTQLIQANPHHYELILLDLTMPGPKIEDVIEIIRNVGSEAKIIIITGAAKDDRIEAMLIPGKVAYVPKPFSPKNLLMFIDKMTQL